MFLEDPIENVRLSVGNNIRHWVVSMTGAKGTIYAGEKFRLKFNFPVDYPFSPPSVYFLQPIPRHEHVYSNGDICLNLLGKRKPCASMCWVDVDVRWGSR